MSYNTPTPKEPLPVTPPAIVELEDDNLWERHKNKVLATAFIGAAALTLNELGPIKHDIEESARWTVPALIASETVATTGLAAMVASTGNKIGNPFTLRSRLKELRQKLTASPMYRAGAYANLAGAAGTSSIIAAETLKDLPVNAWPLALGVAGVSTALSVPFYRIARREDTVEGNE